MSGSWFCFGCNAFTDHINYKCAQCGAQAKPFVTSIGDSNIELLPDLEEESK